MVKLALCSQRVPTYTSHRFEYPRGWVNSGPLLSRVYPWMEVPGLRVILDKFGSYKQIFNLARKTPCLQKPVREYLRVKLSQAPREVTQEKTQA